MSLANILKRNTNRVDGYFKNLKVDSLDINFECDVSEVNLRELRLKSDSNFTTTLSTLATQNYNFIFPSVGPTETSLVVHQPSGLVNYLTASDICGNLPIGGNLVVDSLTADSFIKVNDNDLRIGNGITGGQVTLECQTDDDSVDKIKFPNTVNPNAPVADMVLTVLTSTGFSNGYDVDTIWKRPSERKFIKAYTDQTINYTSANRGVAFDFVVDQILEINTTYRIEIDVQWFKNSSGSNNPNFWVYIANDDLQPFRYAGRSFSNIRDSLSRSTGETIDQTVSICFLTAGVPADTWLKVRWFNNSGAWTDWFARYKVHLYKEFGVFTEYESNGNPTPS